jgi:hypothetical protein
VPTIHRRFRHIIDRVSEAGYPLVLSAMAQLFQFIVATQAPPVVSELPLV